MTGAGGCCLARLSSSEELACLVVVRRGYLRERWDAALAAGSGAGSPRGAPHERAFAWTSRGTAIGTDAAGVCEAPGLVRRSSEAGCNRAHRAWRFAGRRTRGAPVFDGTACSGGGFFGRSTRALIDIPGRPRSARSRSSVYSSRNLSSTRAHCCRRHHLSMRGFIVTSRDPPQGISIILPGANNTGSFRSRTGRPTPMKRLPHGMINRSSTGPNLVNIMYTLACGVDE